MTRQAAASGTGIATSTLQAAEAGMAVPLSTTLAALAALYGVSIDSLFVHAPDAATPDNGRGTDSAPPKVESAA